MFQSKRYLASSRILFYTILLALCCDAVHLAVSPYLAPSINLNASVLRGQSARAYAAKESGQDYCAIIGSSSGIDGFVLSALRKETGKLWANFSIRAGSYAMLEVSAQPVFDSGLHLETCVFTMHPLVLGQPTRGTHSKEGKEKISVQLESWASALQGVGYHRDLSLELGAELAEMTGTGTRHARNSQLNGWQQRGHFNPDSYTTDSHEYQAARRLLANLDQMSDRVLLVRMPEEPAVQERIPASALALFEEFSRGHQVLNLQNLLQPDEFTDGVHPNEKGRQKITMAVSQFLNQNPGNELAP